MDYAFLYRKFGGTNQPQTPTPLPTHWLWSFGCTHTCTALPYAAPKSSVTVPCQIEASLAGDFPPNSHPPKCQLKSSPGQRSNKSTLGQLASDPHLWTMARSR
eukprot:EG_transcript_56532